MNTKIFTSTIQRLSIYNGPITVLRPLTKDEADIDEVGPMYRCKAEDGTEFDAFEDELA